MIKKLTPIGNSLGLIIDRPILQLLNIDRDTELEISTDGQTLTIRPARANEEARADQTENGAARATSVRQAARSLLDEFRDALK